ncbi:hypothetical protein [Bradyrhizobium guangdongense]
MAEIETRIAALRAQQNGEGQPLTRLNAIALAGRWYVWFVRQHEANPGPPKYWKEFGDHLTYNVLYPEAPESFLENSKADPNWEWAKEPEVREAVRPQVAELARVATFLASGGEKRSGDGHLKRNCDHQKKTEERYNGHNVAPVQARSRMLATDWAYH